MTTIQSVAKWLDAYIAAWKSYDPNAIRALFSENAEYRHSPYDEPIIGREDILANWLEDPDDPDSFDADYQPVAVNGDVAVARGQTQYFDPVTSTITAEYDNVFIMRFDGHGRCEEFTEWYMKPRGQ